MMHWLLATALLLAPSTAPETLFVEQGVPRGVQEAGGAWTRGNGFLEAAGVGRVLMAGKPLGPGDFHVRARLALSEVAGSAASFVLNGNSHFGFEGRGGAMFVEGPLFGGTTRALGPRAEVIREGAPFLFEVERKGSDLTFTIDGRQVYRVAPAGAGPLLVGFRPWRSRMQLFEFSATGVTVEPVPHTEVFRSGTEGYHTFRIPSLLATPRGALLAFCEGRKGGSGDSGSIDLVLKRSLDGGETWGPLQVVWHDGANTCGNPCPVVDRDTGTIWLLLTHNLGQDPESRIIEGTSEGTRTVWVTKSSDEGGTWSKPVEITATAKAPEWTWYATGPGVGIQLRSGRLLIPCDHVVAGTKAHESHVLYSDDHGATWKRGGTIAPNVNECQVAERADGTLLMNLRNHGGKSPHYRAISTSADGGLTWSPVTHDDALIEPVCQASLLRLGDARPGGEDRLLFSNPASTAREKMTVRLSRDGGKSWPASLLLHPGPAAYSCLSELPDGRVGCLYERGWANPYESIILARFPLEALASGLR